MKFMPRGNSSLVLYFQLSVICTSPPLFMLSWLKSFPHVVKNLQHLRVRSSVAKLFQKRSGEGCMFSSCHVLLRNRWVNEELLKECLTESEAFLGGPRTSGWRGSPFIGPGTRSASTLTATTSRTSSSPAGNSSRCCWPFAKGCPCERQEIVLWLPVASMQTGWILHPGAG